MKLRDDFVPSHVEIADTKVEYQGAIFSIIDDEIRFAAQDVVRRQYMIHDDAVGVVALRHLDSRPEILLIRQYRHAPRRILWEIPAGLCDKPGEDPVLSAVRELAEETDMRATHWYPLVSFLTSPGCSTEDLSVFLATDLHDVDRAAQDFQREAEEREIVKEWYALDDVVDAVLRGDLHSPTLVAGVLAAHVALGRGLDKLEEIQF